MLLTAPVFAAKTYQELAKQYTEAYLKEDVEGLLSLEYDAWSQCKRPEYNEQIQSRLRDNSFDSKNLYIDYRLLEVKELNPRFNPEEFGNLEGIGQVEYYPIEPTHKMTFWAKSGGMSTRYIAKVDQEWYFLHVCAGKDVDKYLEYEALLYEK